MKAQEYYQAGQLREAVTAATEEVRQHPAAAAPRGFLCELLCFTGDLERADRQLDALATQDPQAILGINVFRHLIRAEQARQQFYTGGRLPDLLGPPSPCLRLHLEASIRLREGQEAEAAGLLAQAEEQRPKVTGTCNGRTFEELRDLDDFTSCFFEVLTSNGKYYWVPMEHVEAIEFRPPARPRDLLWQRAHLVVREGPDGEVFLPTLYAGAHAEADDQIRLGRATAWKGGAGVPVRGIGQRTLLVGSEGRPVLEIQDLVIHNNSQN